MVTCFVGRQPIFNRNNEVYAYELLYRSSLKNAVGDVDFDVATSQLIMNAFIEIGLVSAAAVVMLRLLHRRIGLLGALLTVLMLIAMFWMVNEAGTTDIPTLMAYNFPVQAQTWLWLAFFASFAVSRIGASLQCDRSITMCRRASSRTTFSPSGVRPPA